MAVIDSVILPVGAELADGRFTSVVPDLNFGTNPAKVRYTPDLTGYPEPLANAYRKRENAGRPSEPQKGP